MAVVVAPSPNALLTVSQTAKELGIHPNTLRAYADAGEIQCKRLPGGHRRFTRQQIDAFLESHTGSVPKPKPEDVEIEL